MVSYDSIKKKAENNNDVSYDYNNNSTITISRRFYDITNLITPDMLIYPGDPQPEFISVATLQKDKVNVTRITIGSHTGTHIDAQKHFIDNGLGVDKEPLNKFIGEVVILDISKKVGIGQGIKDYDLDDSSITKIGMRNDILLLYTGTSDKWRIKDESIKNNFTYLEPSAAQWIVDHNIKCVGIDTFSIEKYGFKEGLAHKKLLSNRVGIIENLSSNLKKFIGKRMFLVCLPLLLEDIDGSPARTILFDLES
jgi:Predicted metal-dependent hydrolase